MWASSNGHTEIVQLLLAHNEIDVNIQNSFSLTALELTLVDKVYIEITKLLLSHKGIIINTENILKFDLKLISLFPMFYFKIRSKFILFITPLMMACDKNNKEIVQLILSLGENDVNLQDI